LTLAAALAGQAGKAVIFSNRERELRIYAGLHDAAARGDAAEIEQLIAEGEKPNIQDANSRTPLLVAAFLRRHAATQALLAARCQCERARCPGLRYRHHRSGE
jgi:ankyrin repeat protein